MAKDERSLHELAARLRRAGIPHVLVEEPDHPYLGAATALGIAPCDRASVRRFVSRFRLVGGDQLRATASPGRGEPPAAIQGKERP